MDKRDIKAKISEGSILFRAIVEVLGKPKKHVEQAMLNHIKKLNTNENIEIIKKEEATAKKQEDSDLYAIFAELELMAKNAHELISFCFDFMPSSIEIIEPEQLVYDSNDFTDFINDMQARLHTVNMAVQDFTQRNNNLVRNSTVLVRNFVTHLLQEPRSIKDLNRLSGISEMEVLKLLSILTKEGKVEKKGESYLLKNA